MVDNFYLTAQNLTKIPPYSFPVASPLPLARDTLKPLALLVRVLRGSKPTIFITSYLRYYPILGVQLWCIYVFHPTRQG